MKKILLITTCFGLLSAMDVQAQKTAAKKSNTSTKNTEPVKEDKSKRPSPPAEASETTAFGNKITINYSQPAVKGREIGKEIAPFGEHWRTGANEATTIEFTKEAHINYKSIPAGKYSLSSILGEKMWTLIFNKNWKQWGTSDYDASLDVLRVDIEPQQNPEFIERLTFMINKEGRTIMHWGNTMLDFIIQ